MADEGLTSEHLNNQDFKRLAEFIQDNTGIRLPSSKKVLMEGRLRRRVRALGLGGLGDYCGYLFSSGGVQQQEAIHFIDVMTTNKTDFFREPNHFEFLVDHGIEELVAGGSPDRCLRIWSAACSIGAEPYTLAMVLEDLRRERGNFRFEILGTDISTEVLQKAALAIYTEDMIKPVPPEMRRRYLLRAKDKERRELRIAPEIRKLVRFGRVNLIQPPFNVPTGMDLILCRNLLIYFDKATQEQVLRSLCDHLRPGGYLIIGHSESLAGIKLPVTPVTSGVFLRS
jgi:chemotaxis protein methyltransferase CheR